MSVSSLQRPQEARTISEVLGTEASVKELEHDISFAGAFIKGQFVITPTRIIVAEDDVVSREVHLVNAKGFRTVSLVGSGAVEAELEGEPTLLVRFSMRQMPHLANAVKYLNKVAEGTETPYYADVEEQRCPQCQRVYPDQSRICFHCMNKARIMRRLLAMARPHLGLIWIAMALFWLSTGVRLIVPRLYRVLVDGVIKAQVPDSRRLLTYVGLIGLCGLASNLVAIARGLVMTRLGVRLGQDIRQMVYSKIQALSLSYISKRKTGDLMNRVTSDTGTIQSFIQEQVAMAINESLLLLGIGGILFATNWRLAFMVLVPAPFVTFLMSRTRNRFRRMYHQQWRLMDRTNSLLQDILSGMRVVKAFGQERREIGRFRDHSRRFADTIARNERVYNTFYPLVGLLMGTGNFLILYYGGRLVLGEEMQLGELVEFTQYAAMIWGPLRYFTFIPRWFTQAMTSAERLFEVLDEEPEVKDRPNARRQRIVGRVQFDRVTFGYQSYEPVLHEISVDVEPGEMIGLVGHSGAGKSTFVNLICRFYDPDEGRLLIDGIDIREISLLDLRSQIGVVLQEPFLFSGTVYENIAYAKPGARPDEIVRAAKIANAHDFILRFRDGYDTKVGERGQLLSGGERQRISIARAILHDPRILILDEATASVDTETEQQIQEALGRLVKDRTTFAIAHRLSTLRHANRLLVLDKGRVAEQGTHEELYAQGGIYHRLVDAQMDLFKTRETTLNQPLEKGA